MILRVSAARLRAKYFSRSVITSLGLFLPLQLPIISRRLITGRVFAGRRHAWPAFCVSVVGRGGIPVAWYPRSDPYRRSLAHTALILDDWRRNELRDMDGASWDDAVREAATTR